LTSIPIPGRSADRAGYAAAWFPVVGLIIGLVLAAAYRALDLILPYAAANALIIVVLVLITGAVHLDGLADTCDGIAGHRSVEQRLAIMRDSRTGAFGVVGIVLVLLVKYAVLNGLPRDLLTANLVFMPVVSRWAMVYTVFALPYARPSGLGSGLKQDTRWPQFVIATAITLAIAAAMFPFFSLTGFIMIVGVWVVTALFALYLRGKLGGLTGDTYGAVNEVGEAAALLVALIAYTVALYFR
jgi:adenosylcobinamide-GDP ribazoletransferase